MSHAASLVLFLLAYLAGFGCGDPQPLKRSIPELNAAARLPEVEDIEFVTPDAYPADRLAELRPLAPDGTVDDDTAVVNAATAAAPQHFYRRPGYRRGGHSSYKPPSPWRKPLYLYTWCGLAPESNSASTNDFVATIDATPGSPTFGQLVSVVDSPYSHTQAHHCGVDRSGKWLGAGSLLAFLQKSADGSPIPDALLFDLSNPRTPKYSHGLFTPGSACTDEFRPTPDGGFAVSNMCNRAGTTGGGWFKIQPDMKTVQEHLVPNALPSQQFKSANPHGLDFDINLDVAVTSDFADVASTVITDPANPPTPIVQTTVRVWRYSTGEQLKVYDLGSGNANGLMDVRRMPNLNGLKSRRGLFSVTNGLGHLYIVDALDRKPPTRAYCVTADCSDVPGICIQSEPFKRGTRMLLTVYALAQVQVVDISDPYRMKTLDILQMPKGAGGHVVRYNAETGLAAVSTYFLDVPGTVMRFKSDQKVSLLYIDPHKDKIKLLGAVDFTTAVQSKGPSFCHGVAFNSYFEYP